MAKLNLAAYEIVEERPIEQIASYGIFSVIRKVEPGYV